MGNRSSISFKKGTVTSIVLCNHWGGQNFFRAADEYAKQLKEYLKKTDPDGCMPLARYEPNTVMVDFVRWYLKPTMDDRVMSSLYFGKDTSEVDDGDNGHYCVDLDEIAKRETCEKCKGKGYYLVANGPDDIDKEPCECKEDSDE